MSLIFMGHDFGHLLEMQQTIIRPRNLAQKKSSRFLNFIKQIFEVFNNLCRWVVGMSGSLKGT